MVYNGINVPPLIRTDRIISAFQNEIDESKIEEFTNIMRREMLSHDFPPINGYPSFVDEDDIGVLFMNGEVVDESHVGMLVWYVTDGHHRTISAINAELPHLATELDYSCITNEKDLQQYK